MSSAGPWDDIDDAPTVQQDTTRTIDLEMLRRAGEQRAANDAALALPAPPRPAMTPYIPPLPPLPPQPVYAPSPETLRGLGHPTHHVGPDATPLPTTRSSLPARRGGTDLHRVARVLAGVAAGLAVALCIVLLVPRRGDLRVEVRGAEDARAEIFVDGIKRCDAAPCIVRDLRPGARTVQVFAPGLDAPTITEVIAAGEQRVAVVALKPSSSTPPRAVERPVLAAADPIPAPPPIEPESAVVVVSSPPVVAAPASQRPLAPRATAAAPPPPPQNHAPPPAVAASGTGTLNINSMPASKVMLDGSPLGETPRAGLSVSAGKHTVTFVHKDLGRKSVTVTVRPGEAASASVRFKP